MIIDSKTEDDTLTLAVEGHFDNTSVVEMSLRLNQLLVNKNHLVIDVSNMRIEESGVQFFKLMLGRLTHLKSITVRGLNDTLQQNLADLSGNVKLLTVA